MYLAPRMAIGAILFVLALSWTTYAIYLPQLAKAAGIPVLFVPWLLAIDQIIFALADWASGMYADRTLAIMQRLVPTLLVLTFISTVAFALLPVIGPVLGPDGFFFMTITWVVTTAALRAPPMAMLGSYVPPASRPSFAAATTLALAFAAAVAPYLGKAIREIDPRWPFMISAVAVMIAAFGLYHVERTMKRIIGTPSQAGRPSWLPSFPAFMTMALLLALGFQSQVLMLPTQLTRAVPKDLIENYLPLFWAAFAIAGAMAAVIFKRIDARLAMIVGSVVAAAGASLAAVATSAPLLSIAHLAAGGAWGVLMTGLFAIALAHGANGDAGRAAGIVFGALALTACARIAVGAMGWTGSPVAGERLAWTPGVAWLAAALLIAVISPGGRARQAAREGAPTRYPR